MNKKFIKSIKLSDYEIETEDGWKDITHIHKTILYDVWIIRTKNYELRCADEHIVMSENFEQVYVENLKTGDEILTKTGSEEVISIEHTKEKENMYDVTVDSKNHTFYSNGILSHNTTVATIYLLHYALFNEDKTIAILANKESTSIEILSRIKLAFMELPLWMQKGVDEQAGGWAKKKIGLENGVKIVAESTASSAIRGLTAGLVFLDEFAFVPDNIASDFMSSVYPVIVSGKKAKIIIVSCVTDDTYVFTDKGVKQVKDFIDYDKKDGYNIDEYSVYGKEKLNTGNILYNQGRAKTNIIKSTSTSLECSETHKLWACKNGKYDWYKSNDLEVGDFISIKYGMNVWGDNDAVDFTPNVSGKHRNVFKCKKITKDISYFLGLFLADGYARKIKGKNDSFRGGQIVITCCDDISRAISDIGLDFKSYDGLHYCINSKSLLEFIEYLGFDINKKEPKKTIPKRLMEMSRDNIIALIQGMMDGDGYSRKDKGTIGIGLSSKEMVLQIKMLLLNLGVMSDYLEFLTKPTKLVKVSSMCYSIHLNKHNSKKYYDGIGFRLKRKQLNEEVIKDLEENKNRWDIIPFSKQIIQDNMDSDIRKLALSSGYHKKQLHFSRQYLLRYKDAIMNTDNDVIKELVRDNVSENIQWEAITKIEKSENNVYDFSLPEVGDDKWCHSVLYNGLIGHQTPSGLNHFYHIWRQATRNENNFMPIRISWDEIPGRNNKWKEEIIRDIGPQKFSQEFACILSNTKLKVLNIKTNKEEIYTIEELYKKARE